MNDFLSRRDVIKTIVIGTATSLIGNKAWAAKTVSEIAANIDPDMGIAKIQLASFPALNNNGGSVRLSSFGASVDSAFFKPIIITRVTATEFTVLDSECSHAGCVVNAFVGTPTNGRITCNCHGSQYDIQGNVVQGPASFPLLQYTNQVANGNLTIELPGYGFTVSQAAVLNGSEKRVELSFRGSSATQFQVRRRTTLDGPSTITPFATSLSGAMTLQFTTGSNFTTPRRIYIAAQDGIYQVAIRLTPA